MVGSTARMVWKQPFMLSVTMSSNSSGVVSTPVLPIGPEPPATLTRMSMRPKASFAAAAARSHCVGIGEIAGHDDRLGAERARLLRHRLDRRDVAADQRELAALRREGLGDGRAHSLGGTGDHRDPSVQLQVHGRFRRFHGLSQPGGHLRSPKQGAAGRAER